MCIMLYVDYLADSVEMYHIVHIIIKGVRPGSMLGLLYFTTYAKNDSFNRNTPVLIL